MGMEALGMVECMGLVTAVQAPEGARKKAK
jgi:microcompartment protein CcmL/EutN